MHGIIIIEIFDIPEVFIAIISSVLVNFKNNQTEDNKIIKGNKLKIKFGTINIDIKIGIKIPILRSLKKLISSNKFIIVAKEKKAIIIVNIIFKKSFDTYLFIIKDFNIVIHLNFHI